MLDAKTPTVFALRELGPGKIEAVIVADGEEVIYAPNHRQLWRIVSEGIQMLSRFPPKDGA